MFLAVAAVAATTVTMFGSVGAVECPTGWRLAGEPEPGYAVAIGRAGFKFVPEDEVLSAPSWPGSINREARKNIADKLYQPAERIECQFHGPQVVGAPA